MSLDIILVDHGRGQTRRFHVTSMRLFVWIPAALGMLAIISTSFWLGFKAAPRDTAMIEDSLAEQWLEEMAVSRIALDGARDVIESNMLALSKRLGQLQAHVARLNAVGRRMTEMASISQDEFNFDSEPPLGGPTTENLAIDGNTAQSLAELAANLDAFAAQLDQREREMKVLQDLMVASRLREQIYPSGQPVKRGWVSSGYGRRSDPFSGRRTLHKGVDFAAPHGSEVLSAAAGVVTMAHFHKGYGKLVEINHGNGYVTRYGHNSAITVKVGERVQKGQTIAKVGSTGRSTGPHLHFEVLRNGKVVNPAEYIYAGR